MRYQRKHFVVTAVLVIVLFFSLPRNYAWLSVNILTPPVSYADQLKQLDPVDRRILRYGYSYGFYMSLAGFFARVSKDSTLVLFPPNDYFRSRNINFSVPEPAEFYYHTGYRAVWANSPDAWRANCVVVPYQNWVTLKGIRSEEETHQLLELYKPYLPR